MPRHRVVWAGMSREKVKKLNEGRGKVSISGRASRQAGAPSSLEKDETGNCRDEPFHA